MIQTATELLSRSQGLLFAAVRSKAGFPRPEESLRIRFAAGAVWSVIGTVLSQALALVISVLTARLLGREEFGKFGMVQSTIGIFGVFAGFGLGVTATKYVAQWRVVDRARTGRIIGLSLLFTLAFGSVVAVLFVVLAPVLALKTLKCPDLDRALCIGAIILVLNALNGAQIGILSGFEGFKAVARTNLVRGLFSVPIVVAGAALWRLEGALWGLALAGFIGCLVNLRALQRECRNSGVTIRYVEGLREWRVLLAFSLPVILSATLVSPPMWLASTVLIGQPNGYAEMGIVSAATQWRTAITFLPSALSQLALPLLASLQQAEADRQYRSVLRWNLIITGSSAVAAAIPICLVSPWLMGLYGPSFAPGWPVLIMSALTAVLISVNSVIGSLIATTGSVWHGLFFNLLWAILLLVLAVLLVPLYLARGLAAALLLAYVAHTLWQGVYAAYCLCKRLPAAFREH